MTICHRRRWTTCRQPSRSGTTLRRRLSRPSLPPQPPYVPACTLVMDSHQCQAAAAAAEPEEDSKGKPSKAQLRKVSLGMSWRGCSHPALDHHHQLTPVCSGQENTRGARAARAHQGWGAGQGYQRYRGMHATLRHASTKLRKCSARRRFCRRCWQQCSYKSSRSSPMVTGANLQHIITRLLPAQHVSVDRRPARIRGAAKALL